VHSYCKGKSVTRYLRSLPPGFQWRQTFLFALASHSINLFHQLFFVISSLEFLTGDILLFIKKIAQFRFNHNTDIVKWLNSILVNRLLFYGYSLIVQKLDN